MRCFADLVILSMMKLKTLSPSEKWNVVFLKDTKMRNALGVGEVSGRMFYLILLRHGNTSLISSNHCYLPEICCCYCCADVFCWLNKFLMGFIIVYMFVFFFTINSDNRSNQISVMCWLWTIANNCSKFGLGCLGLALYLW